jgi:hypothetical protein
MYQFDVKNAFVHGYLEEEIYMKVIHGLECSTSMGKVCKLQKALNDLKQSLRAWFELFFELCRDLITNKVKLIIHFLSNILLEER